jgi:hypothetical protein
MYEQSHFGNPIHSFMPVVVEGFDISNPICDGLYGQGNTEIR